MPSVTYTKSKKKKKADKWQSRISLEMSVFNSLTKKTTKKTYNHFKLSVKFSLQRQQIPQVVHPGP